jgi:hypothetical protein
VVISQLYHLFAGLRRFPRAKNGQMYADPVTWSLRERIARCREQADLFAEMARGDNRFICEFLAELARQFDCCADNLQELP